MRKKLTEALKAKLSDNPNDLIKGSKYFEKPTLGQIAAIRKELLIIHAGIAVIIILLVMQILIRV